MKREDDESRCYTAQLQIDTYLDGELRGESEHHFLSHIGACRDCARELRYAQRLHEAVLDLPRAQCSDEFVAGILARAEASDASATSDGSSGEGRHSPGWLQQLLGLLQPRPLIAAAAFASLLIAVAIGVGVERQGVEQSLVAVETQPVPPEPAFDAEEVRAALVELNTAIDYLNRVGRQTEEMIGERFVLAPLQESVQNSLRRASFEEVNSVQGPI
jgi:anti-sigma factor RsiW